MKPSSFPSLSRLALLFFSTSVIAVEAPPPGPDVIRGPIFSGTIKASFPGPNIAMKGIVVTVGQDHKAYLCYDMDLFRVSIGWTGDFLNFGNGQTQIQHPQPPDVKGTPAFGTRAGPGWAKNGSFTDPRPKHQGPLPHDWARYRGLYLNGQNVIFSYSIGDCNVLEMPGAESTGGPVLFTRTFNIERSSQPLDLLVAEFDQPSGVEADSQSRSAPADGSLATLSRDGKITAAGLRNAPAGASWQISGNQIQLKLPALKRDRAFQVVIWSGATGELASVSTRLTEKTDLPKLSKLCRGGPAQWTEPVITQGVPGTNQGPYVVDTITEPSPNPWHAKTFFGGFDFFPDGRAAVCTFHGDVWIVSGINDRLDKLVWKRFATGLFQPLGLKIVDNTIYVTCRDQINRLHDLNRDGEADFYENFNNDTVVTANYHEFCLDLHTDSHGNFYYCKGSPWPPNVESPHQGTMLKVSRDGSKMEVFATGLRAPNGMTVGPDDVITVSDNQGHWMPSSKLNLVHAGGFYGMMPAAHHDPAPSDFEKPLCWLPMSMDNSSGGQTFVTSGKWGPFKGHLLFLSYGKCTLFHVMSEEIDGVRQGGMYQLPLKFQSGLMRARFNPRDGQLYLSGLRGWQTSATRDGGLYRVRYTGQPVNMPFALHATSGGMTITFTAPLQPAAATNADNYNVEQWNYRWTANYGSPEFSLENPDRKDHHDKIEVKAVELSADRKTVKLRLPGIKPSDQMKIKFNIASADGAEMSQEIYNTIYKLGPDR